MKTTSPMSPCCLTARRTFWFCSLKLCCLNAGYDPLTPNMLQITQIYFEHFHLKTWRQSKGLVILLFLEDTDDPCSCTYLVWLLVQDDLNDAYCRFYPLTTLCKNNSLSFPFPWLLSVNASFSLRKCFGASGGRGLHLSLSQSIEMI